MTSNVLKLTKPSWIDKNYACATLSILPANRQSLSQSPRAFWERDWQTDFTPKRVVVSRLHDTVAKSRTGVKFSPRCENRGELTPGRLAPAWHFVVVSCKQMQSYEREPEWTRPDAKVAPVSCKQPLSFVEKCRVNGSRPRPTNKPICRRLIFFVSCNRSISWGKDYHGW